MHPIPLTLRPLTSHLSCRQQAGEEQAQPCFRSHNTVIRGNNHLGQPCKDTCTEALGFLPTGYQLQYQGDTQKGWADRLLKAAPGLSGRKSHNECEPWDECRPWDLSTRLPLTCFPSHMVRNGSSHTLLGGMQNGPTTLGVWQFLIKTQHPPTT